MGAVDLTEVSSPGPAVAWQRGYRAAVKRGHVGLWKYQDAGGTPDLSFMIYNVGGLTDLKLLKVIRRTKDKLPDVIMLLDATIAGAEEEHLKHLCTVEGEFKFTRGTNLRI